MKDKMMKDKILALMEKERSCQVTYLSKERIDYLIHKFQHSELSDDERSDIANHILANFIEGTVDDPVDEMIGWLLSAKNNK